MLKAEAESMALNPVIDEMPRRSLKTAYVLLASFGLFGVHKFYLGKPGMGMLYACTFGLFSFGTMYDFFTLPQQVRRANAGFGGRVLKRSVPEDAPSSLSDPDAIVARYLSRERAETRSAAGTMELAGPKSFGRRKRVV